MTWQGPEKTKQVAKFNERTKFNQKKKTLAASENEPAFHATSKTNQPVTDLGNFTV